MQIQDFYRDVLGFRNEEVIEELSVASRLYKYKKGQILVRQGEIQKAYVSFLKV